MRVREQQLLAILGQNCDISNAPPSAFIAFAFPSSSTAYAIAIDAYMRIKGSGITPYAICSSSALIQGQKRRDFNRPYFHIAFTPSNHPLLLFLPRERTSLMIARD